MIKQIRTVSIFVSLIAIIMVVWFDSTHTFWSWSECINFQEVEGAKFSLLNIGDWIWLVIPVLLANFVLYLKRLNLSQWFDLAYGVRCIWGIFVSVIVAYSQLPWDGIVRIMDNTTSWDNAFFLSLFITAIAVFWIDIAYIIHAYGHNGFKNFYNSLFKMTN